MKSIDITRFRRDNNILQKTLADYLGVTRGYLSQVENKKCELSYPKLKMLLENDRGWDTSMLVNDSNSCFQTIGNHSNNNTQVAGGDIAMLQEKVAMLEKLLEEKERTIQILLNR